MLAARGGSQTKKRLGDQMKQAFATGAGCATGTVLYGYIFTAEHAPDWPRALFVGVFVFALALIASRIWPKKTG